MAEKFPGQSNLLSSEAKPGLTKVNSNLFWLRVPQFASPIFHFPCIIFAHQLAFQCVVLLIGMHQIICTNKIFTLGRCQIKMTTEASRDKNRYCTCRATFDMFSYNYISSCQGNGHQPRALQMFMDHNSYQP